MRNILGWMPTRPARTWTDFQRLRVGGKEPGYRRLDKLEVAELASSLGVRTPRILRQFATVEDIDLSDAPEHFVLKPTDSKSRHGVMLLHRRNDGVFWDSLRGRSLTLPQILAEQAEVQRDHMARFTYKPPLTFFTEQLLRPDDGSEKVPNDYKVFAFNGELKVIQQIDRNHPVQQLAFFTGNFEIPRRSPVSLGSVREGTHVIPRHAEEILDIARRISVGLRTPFARIDCYSTPEGAYLGEITLTPGGPYYGTMHRFTREYEVLLGRAYAEAYRALGMKPASVPLFYDVMYRGKPARPVDWRGYSPEVRKRKRSKPRTLRQRLLPGWGTSR